MKILAYLALLFWMVLGWKYYTDYKTCNTSAIGVADSQVACPICFKWTSPNPEVCSNWETIRDSIVSNLPKGQSLLIRTWYNPIESDDSELGRNRAVSIKALFNGIIDESRIVIESSKHSQAEHTDCQAKSSIGYYSESEIVQQQENNATLHLENKSIAANPEIREYLDELAARIKKSGEKVMIAGHTDSDGSEVNNLKLGYQKAEEVKAYLLALGIDKEKLITISKGENEPLENNTNATAEEKAANRRIEIKIINS